MQRCFYEPYLYSLLLFRILRRLATLLSQQACLMASNEAFKKQAEGANDAAKRYMEENEKLQEVSLTQRNARHAPVWPDAKHHVTH